MFRAIGWILTVAPVKYLDQLEKIFHPLWDLGELLPKIHIIHYNKHIYLMDIVLYGNNLYLFYNILGHTRPSEKTYSDKNQHPGFDHRYNI